MLLIVDGNNLFMRAWHATQNEAMTANGESTAALVVFVNTLMRHIREERPEKVVVCWDGGGSAYRLRLLPTYKANRRQGRNTRSHQERKRVKEFLSLAGVFHIERLAVEADDLVAKYWHDSEDDVLVVSEDKDFLQLAGETPQGGLCEILRSTGERWNSTKVKKATGTMPRQIPKVMALTGDVSDNIIGVPGIGPRRAVQLLNEAGWDLEAIEDPRVAEMRSQVLLNRILVNLRLPLPGLEIPPPPVFEPTERSSALYDELISFLERYQLKGLLSKAILGTLWRDPEDDDWSESVSAD